MGYLTAADENVIISSSAEDMIMTLIRSKVYEPDLRPDDMLNGDIEAILIFLRNTAFGPEYKLQVIDPQTGKKFPTTLMLDELNFKRGEIENLSNSFFNYFMHNSTNNTFPCKRLCYNIWA